MKTALLLAGLVACLGAGPVAELPAPVNPVRLEGPTLFHRANQDPGDSVLFVLRFDPPAQALDSVVVKWGLAGNANQLHTLLPPYPATVQDTARFAAPPLSPGGSSATGSVVVQTWRLGFGSPGVTLGYVVTRAGPAPPLDVTGAALVDSAVAYP